MFVIGHPSALLISDGSPLPTGGMTDKERAENVGLKGSQPVGMPKKLVMPNM